MPHAMSGSAIGSFDQFGIASGQMMQSANRMTTMHIMIANGTVPESLLPLFSLVSVSSDFP